MNSEHKKILLKIARKAIIDYLEFKKKFYPTPDEVKEKELWLEKGSFVTLTIEKELRGCIGSIMPVRPLTIDIYDNAINAAFRDPRFYPLSRDELKLIDIEISVLTVPQKVTFKDYNDLLEKIRTGIDGVIIRRGYYQATFLPQVWNELPEKVEFIEHLCLKAGLSRNCYKENALEVETYQVESFKESEFNK